jgi:hypothetical protein
MELERLLGCPEKHMEFHIWYLKEKGCIERTDTGGFAITAEGVDSAIEQYTGKKGSVVASRSGMRQ